MPSASSSRRTLRRQFRLARRELPPEQQLANSERVARHLVGSTLILKRGRVGAYLPNDADGELNPIACVQRLWAMGRRVCVPVLGREHGFMDLYEFAPGTRLVRNRLGIAEPAPGSPHVNVRALTLLLVPLVAFDDRGGRLGMGGGFYDRFLSTVPAMLRPRIVGLAHEVQRSATPLPADRWDVPLDAVITEAGVEEFR